MLQCFLVLVVLFFESLAGKLKKTSGLNAALSTELMTRQIPTWIIDSYSQMHGEGKSGLGCCVNEGGLKY